jgi:superfamily II DNA or RNA helicase
VTGEAVPIQPGDFVSGLEPDELVEVQRIVQFGTRYLVEGVGVRTRRVIRRPATASELGRLQKVRSTQIAFDGDPDLFLLGAEAERIRIAHQFDPLFAVNSSIVDPLPHQIEAVYRYLLPLPRIRFLLADDTGAGKTIMTGLLLKELLFRGVLRKALIVTPGGLTKQWLEEELQERFGIEARLVNHATFEANPAQFARNEDGIFVVSIDFLARNEGCLKAARETHWDMIVVDEAHKLSAYEYGSKLEESARYLVVKALADRTDHLLFLTATPHRGRRDTFRRLLMLLDRDLFSRDEHIAERIRTGYSEPSEEFEAESRISRARNRFFLRRLKEEMVDWDNQPLFKPRHSKTVGYDLTPEEKQLYDEVTNYVRSKRKEAKAKRNRNVELTLMVMQRRLASSIYAISRTLSRRLNALNEVLRILQDSTKSTSERKRLVSPSQEPEDPRDLSEYEERDEAEREGIDERIFRQVLTDDPNQIIVERDEVARLHRLAESLKQHKEAKFLELLKVLDSSNVIRAENEKLVIFTEHKDTLDSLEKRLREKGYTVATIDGSMDVDARKNAQLEFRRHAKILVATDAAGEGINLQFCRFLINWDIPWNPNRLEQRMGRIHRYGQKDDVWVYNLVAQNTREGAVLETILRKLDVMRDQMGDDRVYDVIDELLEGVPLVRLVEDAIDSDDPESIRKKVENALRGADDSKAKSLIALQKKTSLSSRLDLRSAIDLRDASEERRLQPLFIQRFFERAWIRCGGSLRRDDQFPVWYVGPTPNGLLELARERRVPLSDHYETPYVFDKQLVSVASSTVVPDRTKLLGPGHPLFETLVAWTIREAQESFVRGAVLIDPNLARPQHAWLVRSVVHDARVGDRLRVAHERLAVVAADHMGIRTTSPSYFLNCVSPEERTALPETPAKGREEVQAWAYEEVTEKQLQRIRLSRNEECELRREYLETAFSDLILELQAQLNDLEQSSLLGADEPEEREALRGHVLELMARKAERMAELERMKQLSADLPDVLAEALVIPSPVAVVETESPDHGGVPMMRDDEVEAIAMEIATRYERGRGWSPLDVTRDGEHYDLRSEAPSGEKRFIEVKGRAQTGPVMVTAPELDRLRQLGSRAWLYVVTYCRGARPRLRIIRDPAEKLNPAMLYRQVQYIVNEDDWKRAGQEVEIGEKKP